MPLGIGCIPWFDGISPGSNEIQYCIGNPGAEMMLNEVHCQAAVKNNT